MIIITEIKIELKPTEKRGYSGKLLANGEGWNVEVGYSGDSGESIANDVRLLLETNNPLMIAFSRMTEPIPQPHVCKVCYSPRYESWIRS